MFESGGRDALCMLVLVFCTAWVYWPGIHGFWGRDDFAQLAMARMVGTPWSFFLHDHYPVPGSEYRPLGYASMWLGQALLGSDYAAHAQSDLLLHICVGLALFGVLRKAETGRAVALVCTVLFALHPAVIGTALWWSARFDLLATLFILLAVWSALAYRRGRRPIAFAGMLVAAFAAMLSKEIGLVAVAVLSLLALRWAWSRPDERGAALRMLGGSLACALGYIGLRRTVLGTLGSTMTASVPMRQAIANGLLAWPADMPGYVSFWARMTAPQHAVFGLALLLMIALLVVSVRRRRPRARNHPPADLLVCGACLFLLPAVLQAPVAGFAMPLNAHMSAVDSAMQSRLYYLGIAGVAMLVAAVLSWAAQRLGKRAGLMLAVATSLLVVDLAGSAHHAAAAFAVRSSQIAQPARQAVAQIASMRLPRNHCQIVFLGVEPPPEWSVFVSMDSIVKALSPNPQHVGHCWFHDDYRASFNLQAAPASPADAMPYQPLRIDGKRVRWRTIGHMVIAYVVPPATLAPGQKAKMIFLRYTGGRFSDVSREVVAGELQPQLR